MTEQVAKSASLLEPLDLTRLASQLREYPIGHTIHHYESLPSTMPTARKLIKQPPPLGRTNHSGTLIVTEEQTQGRGRQQRTWHAPPRTGLLVSIVLQPPHLPRNPAHLPMLAGVAVVRAIAAIVPALVGKVGLKWPNDVLIAPDASKLADAGKVAGLLAESTFRGNMLGYAILGMGINANQTTDALPPTAPNAPDAISLHTILGYTVDRTELLIALCQTLSELVAPESINEGIVTLWRNRLLTLGQLVAIHERPIKQATAESLPPSFTGMAIDVTDDGALIVEDERGHRHTVTAGDVSLRIPMAQPD